MDANAGFGIPRFITEDVELSGVTVKAGSTVVNSMAAANRDPGTFPDPEQFDPSRAANTHLAFGAGAHSCLGQALARTELQVTLEVLLDNCATGRAGDEAGLHPLKDRRSLNEAREF